MRPIKKLLRLKTKRTLTSEEYKMLGDASSVQDYEGMTITPNMVRNLHKDDG